MLLGLIFGDGSGQSRDSSAAAVAVCGMQEMCNNLPETDEDKEVYNVCDAYDPAFTD